MQTTPERPAETAGELYIKTDISPEQVQEAIERLREQALIEIERLIDFIDSTDQYASDEREAAVDDVACDTDELEAEFATTPIEDRKPGAGGCHWDGRSFLDGAELDESDREPSLGAAENHVMGSPPGIWAIDGQYRSPSGNQTDWAQGNRDECEGDEHDGREPDVEDEGAPTGDDEPSLGWTEYVDQTRRGGDSGPQPAPDLEICPRVDSPAARQRYREHRYQGGVHAENFGYARRISGLTKQQLKSLRLRGNGSIMLR